MESEALREERMRRQVEEYIRIRNILREERRSETAWTDLSLWKNKSSQGRWCSRCGKSGNECDCSEWCSFCGKAHPECGNILGFFGKR